MRKALAVAAFWSVFVVDANALEQGGIIVSVDGATQTFTVHWGTINMRYKVTERTVFWVGLRKGAWSRSKNRRNGACRVSPRRQRPRRL
jgi:hypothetical protein